MTLAEELATRAQAIVPAFVSVRAAGDWVQVFVRDAWPSGIYLFDDPNRPLADLAANLAYNVLSGLQDAISIETTEPWPRMDSHRRAMALPQVEVRDGELHMWYGDETTAVIRLEPLPVANIVNTSTSR
jgi:hypothetical protein